MRRKYLMAGAGVASLALVACQPDGSQPAPGNQAIDGPDKLAVALAEARDAGDYRLWITGGRRQVMPGIDPALFAEAKALCGIKLIEGSGDVMGDKAQRQQRQAAIAFASDYNARMLILCREQAR